MFYLAIGKLSCVGILSFQNFKDTKGLTKTYEIRIAVTVLCSYLHHVGKASILKSRLNWNHLQSWQKVEFLSVSSKTRTFKVYSGALGSSCFGRVCKREQTCAL